MTSESPRPPGLQIHLLGTFSVALDGIPLEERHWRRKKVRALLAALAVSPRHRLHREQLHELLWPDLDAERAANQLYKAQHYLRRAFEPEIAGRAESRFIKTHGSLVSLSAPGDLWVDAQAFEQSARRAMRSSDLGEARSALALYGGDLCPEDLYEDWAALHRERCRALLDQLLHLVVDLCRRSFVSTNVELLNDVLARDPTNEGAHRLLIELYMRLGRRKNALKQYRACCAALRRELDAEPDPATRRLYRELLERSDVPAGESIDAEALQEPSGVRAIREVSPGAHETGIVDSLPEQSPRPRRSLRLAAAIACAAALFFVGMPRAGYVRYKLRRIVVQSEHRLAALTREPSMPVSIVGKTSVPWTRVEAIDSASGLAAFSDGEGRFTLPGVLWTPGTSYDLVLTSDAGNTEILNVRAPEALEGSVIDVGEIVPGRSVPADGDDLYGLNSVTFLDFDRKNLDFYDGVLTAITSGEQSDAARVDAINLFAASRYSERHTSLKIDSARDVVEGGSHYSGHLAMVMATLAYTAGYDVRLVDVVDPSDSSKGHRLVEVSYEGAWHLYDPAFGFHLVKANGEVPSYEELRQRPELLSSCTFEIIERRGWKPGILPDVYTSGVHHYLRFRDAARFVNAPADSTS